MRNGDLFSPLKLTFVILTVIFIGLKQCGSLNLAQTSERMIFLKRRIAYNVPTGLHCEVNMFQVF